MKAAFGDKFGVYVIYVNRYMEYVSLQLMQVGFTMGNVANKQIPASTDRDIAAMVATIHRLLDYAEAWDTRMDRKIAAVLKAPIYRNQNKHLQYIVKVCKAIENAGYKLEDTPEMDICVKVLANKSAELADSIIAAQG